MNPLSLALTIYLALGAGIAAVAFTGVRLSRRYGYPAHHAERAIHNLGPLLLTAICILAWPAVLAEWARMIRNR